MSNWSVNIRHTLSRSLMPRYWLHMNNATNANVLCRCCMQSMQNVLLSTESQKLLEVVVPVPAMLVQVVDVDLQGLREHLVLEFEPEIK